MKKIYLNIILFMLISILLGTANIFAKKDKTISEIENRTLTQRPEFSYDELFSGKYFENYENFLSDQFAFREVLVSIGSGFDDLKGFKYDGGAVLVVTGGNNSSDVVDGDIDDVLDDDSSDESDTGDIGIDDGDNQNHPDNQNKDKNEVTDENDNLTDD